MTQRLFPAGCSTQHLQRRRQPVLRSDPSWRSSLAVIVYRRSYQFVVLRSDMVVSFFPIIHHTFIFFFSWLKNSACFVTHHIPQVLSLKGVTDLWS